MISAAVPPIDHAPRARLERISLINPVGPMTSGRSGVDQRHSLPPFFGRTTRLMARVSRRLSPNDVTRSSAPHLSSRALGSS